MVIARVAEFHDFQAEYEGSIPFVQHYWSMPDFLTRRNGTWHFVRRVPIEFAHYDARGVVKHSTRIKIANDRSGRRAARVAEKLAALFALTVGVTTFARSWSC
jgi:hypothetical protein